MPLSVMLASKGAVWEKGRVPLNSMQAWVRDAAVRARSIGEDFMVGGYEAYIFGEVVENLGSMGGKCDFHFEERKSGEERERNSRGGDEGRGK